MAYGKFLASFSTFLVVVICHANVFAQTPFWQKLNRPGKYGLFLAVRSDGYVFASTVDTGVWRSTDNGNSWASINQGLFDQPLVKFLTFESNRNILAAEVFGGIYQSTNNGDTWSNDTLNKNPLNTYQVNTLLVDGQYIFAGGVYTIGAIQFDNHAFVFRSSDDGKTWDSMLDSARGYIVYCHSLVADRQGHIFAGIKNEGLYRTDDDGVDWKRVYPDTLGCLFPSAIDSIGRILIGGCDGIYRSVNEGATWEPEGFAGIRITTIVVNSLGDIYVGTDGQGIFRSTNGGAVWKIVNTGLEDSVIQSLAISPDGHVYAQGGSGASYRSVQSTTSVEEIISKIPMSFSLLQNYPNPFNSSTSISYSIPKHTHVRLQIFNPLGQLITTLVNEDKPPGTYTATWDASTRSSGLYFYRMTAGEFVQTKKAVLVR